MAFVSQNTSALRDTWPSGDWQEPWRVQVSKRRRDEYSDDYNDDDIFETFEVSRSNNAVTNSLGGGEPERENPGAATLEADRAEKENPKNLVGHLSLRSRTLASLAEALVHDREVDENALSQAQMLPDFWPAVRAALYKNADSLKSTPKTLDLMYQSLKQETDVDAGPFNTISILDLARVLDRLSHGGQMQTLNLSGRPTLTKDELEVLIEHNVGLRNLYLMGATGSLPITDLTELRFSGEVHHRLLFERAHRAVRSKKPEAGPDIRFVPAEASIRHIAYVTITGLDDEAGKSYLPDSGIDWDSLKVDASWSEVYQSVTQGMRCMKYPLKDTPMLLPRLIIGVRNLFEW